MIAQIWNVIFVLLLITFGVIYFCVFFDQAILTRRGTIYRAKTRNKKIVLTFDDGPSPTWTPLILDELKKAGIQATFFMIGHHVQKYPEVAKRVAREGHTIGNHGYAHSVLLYYTLEELEEEVKYTEHVIREVTGVTTKYFRPPKSWLRPGEKAKIKSMGYKIILWSLNSKDWVAFGHKYMVKYIAHNIKNGDILLFHDSGGVFKAEGGDRKETVAVISPLVKRLQKKGFEFVSIEELLDE